MSQPRNASLGITSYGYIVKNSGETVLAASVKMAFRLYDARMMEKAKDDKLRASEEKFRKLYEYAPIGIFITTSTGKVISVNTAMARMLGFDSSQEPIAYYTNLSEQLYVDPAKRVEFIRRLATDGQAEDFEYEAWTHDGRRVWFSMTAHLVRRGNDPDVYIEGFTRDITEKKRIEDNFRSLSARDEALLDSIPDIIMEVDLAKVYTWANREGIAFFGDDVIGKEANLYFEGEQDTYQIVEPLFHSDSEIIQLESWQRRRDGQKRLLVWRCRQLWDADGRITGVLSSAQDITELRRVQETSRLNEKRLESLLRISQYPAKNIQDLLDIALDEVIALTSSKIGYIYLYDEEKKEFTLNTWSKNVMSQCSVANPETRYRLEATGIWGEAVRQKKPMVVNDFAAPNILKKGIPDGHVKLDRFLTIPVFSEKKIVAVVGVANKDDDYNDSDIRQLTVMMDAVWKIVERQRTGERIAALLAEKELILKETHHRVKNNMGAIYSLLVLHADSRKDQRDREVLLDAARRVQSMVVLYDKLYRSEETRALKIGEFLEPLATQIAGLFSIGAKVEVAVETEDFTVEAKQLSNLGILVNELIANSMKHAFIGRDSGKIAVSMRKEGDTITLHYSDDGIGMPDAVGGGGHSGFGLQLIAMLVDQLDGTVKVVNDFGTTYIIEFKG